VLLQQEVFTVKFILLQILNGLGNNHPLPIDASKRKYDVSRRGIFDSRQDGVAGRLGDITCNFRHAAIAECEPFAFHELQAIQHLLFFAGA
jgi:hypothetical protein